MIGRPSKLGLLQSGTECCSSGLVLRIELRRGAFELALGLPFTCKLYLFFLQPAGSPTPPGVGDSLVPQGLVRGNCKVARQENQPLQCYYLICSKAFLPNWLAEWRTTQWVMSGACPFGSACLNTAVFHQVSSIYQCHLCLQQVSWAFPRFGGARFDWPQRNSFSNSMWRGLIPSAVWKTVPAFGFA